MTHARLLLLLVPLLIACGTTTRTTRSSVSAPAAAANGNDPAATSAGSSSIDPCVVAREPAASFVREAEPTIAEGAARPDAAEARASWQRLIAPMLDCRSAGTGVWILMPSDLSFEWTEGADVMGAYHEGYEIAAHAAWTFVDARGEIHSAPASIELGASSLGSHASSESVSAVFDYDADGNAELITRYEQDYWEGSERRLAMWSFARGSVGPFAPAEGIDLHDVSDFDGDGRPDIVSIGRYWSGVSCGMDPPPEGTPAVLFHSVANGTFSSSDAVAAAYLRERCPAAPTRIFVDDIDCGAIAARERIACARLWGATAENVRARMRRELDRLPERQAEYIDAEWDALEAYVEIDPPVSLASGSPPSR